MNDNNQKSNPLTATTSPSTAAPSKQIGDDENEANVLAERIKIEIDHENYAAADALFGEYGQPDFTMPLGLRLQRARVHLGQQRFPQAEADANECMKRATPGSANYDAATVLSARIAKAQAEAPVRGFAKNAGMPFSVKATDVNGRTLLHRAALGDHLGVVKWLLENGADAKAKDNGRGEPLHCYAAGGNNSEIVDLLVAAGADINAQDQFEETPLDKASMRYMNAVNQKMDAEAQKAEAVMQVLQTRGGVYSRRQ